MTASSATYAPAGSVRSILLVVTVGRHFIGPFLLLAALPLAAQQNAGSFFEDSVRPLLTTNCLPCHNQRLRSSGLAWITTVTTVAKLGASLLFGLAWGFWGPSGAVSSFLVALAPLGT